MKHSFTLRLTLRVALLVTLTVALVLPIGGWWLNRQALQSIEVYHDVEGEELCRLINTKPAPSVAEIRHRLENEADSDIALYLIQIRDSGGKVLYRSGNLGEAFIPEPIDHQRRRNASINGIGDIRVSEFDASGLRIQIGSALAPVSQIMRNYVRVSILLTAGTALLSILVGYAFSRMTLSPIRAIERTARRIRSDNLSERIPVPPGHDELASLAALLNRTFDHLETSFVQIRRFSADVSHELKTPLSLVRLTIEKLRSRLAAASDISGTGAAETDALLADILEETNHMTRVIESLLFIAKAESGAITLNLKPHEMRPFIASFAEDAGALAEDRNIKFQLAQNDTGTPPADPQTLRQLLLNLIANALAASPAGSTVTLDSANTGTGWRLTMTDEGPGLPEEMIERVFERFTRHTSFAENQGTGLGLAICRSIAELHHGTLRAYNRTDRIGLKVVMEW